MFTASAFIRPSRVFMVKSRVKSTVQTINLKMTQSHKIQMTSTMCSTGFPHVWQGTNSPSRVHIYQRWIPIQSWWQPGKRTQVISHRSVGISELFGFGGNFPGTISPRTFPEPGNPQALDDCSKRPVVSFCLFLEQKEPKDYHHPQVSTVNIFPTQYFPQFFPAKKPELLTDSDMWNQPIRWPSQSPHQRPPRTSSSKDSGPTTNDGNTRHNDVPSQRLRLGNMFKASTTCSAHSFWFHTSE